MPILHRPKTDKFNFTKVPNEIIDSEDLSPDAIVVAIWLTSKRSDWIIIKEAIKKRFGFSKERVKKIFNNLLETGYLGTTGGRDVNGCFEPVVYTFYENPDMNPSDCGKGLAKASDKVSHNSKPKKQKASPDESLDKLTVQDKPSSENPSSEKTQLTNTDLIKNIKIQQQDSRLDLEDLLPKEFTSQEKTLLLEDFNKIDYVSAVNVVEQFDAQRQSIKNPVGWIRTMINKSAKGEFNLTKRSNRSLEPSVTKMDLEKRKLNSLIHEKMATAQEQNIKKQIEGFEHAGPGSAASLMKRGTF